MHLGESGYETFVWQDMNMERAIHFKTNGTNDNPNSQPKKVEH